jgi:hypothetical protein
MKSQILDVKKFQYTRAVSTNITKRWEDLGWVKPSNQLSYLDKWLEYRFRR